MIAVRSLNGRSHHLKGSSFETPQTKRRYKTETKECWQCKGEAGKYYRRYDYKVNDYVDMICSSCKSTGFYKYRRFSHIEEAGTVTRFHSLCGTAVLRPETKASVREINESDRMWGVCPACLVVHKNINESISSSTLQQASRDAGSSEET